MVVFKSFNPTLNILITFEIGCVNEDRVFGKLSMVSKYSANCAFAGCKHLKLRHFCNGGGVKSTAVPCIQIEEEC